MASCPCSPSSNNSTQKEDKVVRTYYRLLCLDRRNGRVLHEETSKNYNNMYQIVADSDKKLIEVRIRQSTIKLTFSDEPAKETGN